MAEESSGYNKIIFAQYNEVHLKTSPQNLQRELAFTADCVNSLFLNDKQSLKRLIYTEVHSKLTFLETCLGTMTCASKMTVMKV